MFTDVLRTQPRGLKMLHPGRETADVWWPVQSIKGFIQHANTGEAKRSFHLYPLCLLLISSCELCKKAVIKIHRLAGTAPIKCILTVHFINLHNNKNGHFESLSDLSRCFCLISELWQKLGCLLASVSSLYAKLIILWFSVWYLYPDIIMPMTFLSDS